MVLFIGLKFFRNLNEALVGWWWRGHPAELSMPSPERERAVGRGPVVTFLNATPSFMRQAMRLALGRELYCCRLPLPWLVW